MSGPAFIAHWLRHSASWLLIAALLCLPLADLEVHNASPWAEFGKMLRGFASPHGVPASTLLEALFSTLAFAAQGVALGVAVGFALSLGQRHRGLRWFSASIRAVHEIFWALLFIQVFGLTPLSGVLAIAVPYAGIFAKVFDEQYQETTAAPQSSLPAVATRRQRVAQFAYTTLPLAAPAMVQYIRYRLECGVRSSTVLGFIGLPTLGYHLETAFHQGDYSEGALLLYTLVLLIASLRWLWRPRLLPLYLLAAVAYIPPLAPVSTARLWQFLSRDIVPAPLQTDVPWDQWLGALWYGQAWPGLVNTLVLSQLALVLTGVLALALFPWASRQFCRRPTRGLAQGFLLVMRSTPEYLLTFVLLLATGPSMLPAVLALSLHTSAIIAHLIARLSDTLTLREDAPRGFNRYGYEVLPRVFRPLLAFLLYRWEMILRESAIVGVLGIATLGFYIDSAFAEFHLDRALLLIALSAVLNIAVDALARYLRLRLHSPSTVTFKRDIAGT